MGGLFYFMSYITYSLNFITDEDEYFELNIKHDGVRIDDINGGKLPMSICRADWEEIVKFVQHEFSKLDKENQ
jgi:hypothetical protein